MDKWKYITATLATREYKGFTLQVQSQFIVSNKWAKHEDHDEDLWKWTILKDDEIIDSGHDTSYQEACRTAEFTVREYLYGNS